MVAFQPIRLLFFVLAWCADPELAAGFRCLRICKVWLRPPVTKIFRRPGPQVREPEHCASRWPATPC